MDDSVASALLVYGPLGLIAFLGLAAALKLYRDREVERAENKKAMEVLQERHIAKAETWMAKYQELQTSMNAVLESLTKRYAEKDQRDRR